jgi:hypothetical protein
MLLNVIVVYNLNNLGTGDSSVNHVFFCVSNTGYTQKNGGVSKVNKKFISHLTRAKRTPSAAATV